MKKMLPGKIVDLTCKKPCMGTVVVPPGSDADFIPIQCYSRLYNGNFRK